MNTHRISLVLSLLLVTGFSLNLQASHLQNGDFGSFAGWEGELWDGAATSVGPGTDSHFSLPGAGMAEISNDPVFYQVVLFQQFDLPINTVGLSFDFAWTKTDAFDIVQASLIDATLTLHDLFPLSVDTNLLTNSGSATTDISSLAGQTVTIEFLLSDGDFDENDRFRVGNIEITEAAIPEPGALLLLAIGVAGLAGWKRDSFS